MICELEGSRTGRYGLCEIYLEKGTHGVTPYNCQGRGNEDYEGELILQRKTEFRIAAVRDVPAKGSVPARRQFVLEMVQEAPTPKKKGKK